MHKYWILSAAVVFLMCGGSLGSQPSVNGAGDPLKTSVGGRSVTFRWGTSTGHDPGDALPGALRWRVLGYLLSVRDGGASSPEQDVRTGGKRRVYFVENNTLESAEFEAGQTYSASLAEVGTYLNPSGIEVTHVKTRSMGPAVSFTLPADFHARSGLEAQGPPLVSLAELHAHPDSYSDRVIRVLGSVDDPHAAPGGFGRAQPVAARYSSVDRGLVQGGFELPVAGAKWPGSGGPYQADLIGYFSPLPGRAKRTTGAAGGAGDYCFQELAVLGFSKQ